MDGRRFRWLSVLMVLMLTVIPVHSVYGAAVDIDITQQETVVVLTDEGARIFDIGYQFGVDFDAQATGIDVVLVLDRSNSMLRLDPSTELPVADAVWDAANSFVNEVYATYPDTNIAVVSFGTNANKSDNWKYYDNLEDTLDEIEAVYEYRDLYYNYHSNYRSYWNNGYRYAWENWQISDGATNIAAGFDYAYKTTEMKTTVTKDNEEDVVILFTDGVATQGGSNSQKNYNYPTAHNTNTIAAYEAGIELQEVAEVIVVGYFEGIENASTQQVARDTLERAQSAGFFEASQTGQLTGIFSDIVLDLNYAGTNAKIREIVEDDFIVDPSSIQPGSYSLSTDDQGRTVIEWSLGNVVISDYNFGYKVQVKEDVYPTGSGTVMIPINQNAELIYKDLDGNTVTEYLGQNQTTIPPRSNQPVITFDVTYPNGYNYLVGDTIVIDHTMSFVNQVPFDYEKINVFNAFKEVSGGAFDADLALTPDAAAAGWTVVDGNLNYEINETVEIVGDENLEWFGSLGLRMTAEEAGTYQLTSEADYELTNSADLVFAFNSGSEDPGTINVREGVLRLVMTDDYGLPLTNANVLVDGIVADGSYDEELKQLIVTGITTGNHNITFQVPSGYAFQSADPGVVLVDDDVAFTEAYSFDRYDVTKTISFAQLDVRNIAVTDRLGNSTVSMTQLDETTEAIVTFELMRPLVKVGLNLTDDYDTSDAGFALDQLGGFGVVTGPSGQVNGFTMVEGQLVYEGAELPVGVYRAFGVITPPADFGEPMDYDYLEYVDRLTTKETGELVEDVQTVTSNGLLMGIVDEDPPTITTIVNEEGTTTNLASYDVAIEDMVTIVKVVVYEGVLTMEEIQEDSETLAFEVIEDRGNEQDILLGIQLSVEVVDDQILSTGSATIYAEDAFGNASIETIEIENQDINDLLDNNLR